MLTTLPLNGPRRDALLHASLVCTRWHILAQRVLDTTIGPLTLGAKQNSTNDKLFRRLCRDESFQRRVKNIVVADWFVEPAAHYELQWPRPVPLPSPYEPGCYFSDDWSPPQQPLHSAYTQMLALATALKSASLFSFTWKAIPCLPQQLASALSEQHQCKVHVLRNEAALEYAEKGFYSPYLNTSTLHCLGMVRNMSTLEVLIPAADQSLTDRLARFIRRAASLRKLAVYAVSHMWPPPAKPLELSADFGRSTILPFARLFPLDGECLPFPLKLSSLELVNVCICCPPSKTAQLLNVIEWQNVRHLRITCLGLLRSIQTGLLSLRSLSVSLEHPWEVVSCTTSIMDWTDLDLKVVLQQARHLADFEITNARQLMTPRVIASLPTSIRNMSIRHNPYPPVSHGCMSARCFRLLAKSLPRLETLSLDMPTVEEEVGGVFAAFEQCANLVRSSSDT